MCDGHHIYVKYNTTFYVFRKVKIDFNNVHWEHIFVFQIITSFTMINDTTLQDKFRSILCLIL